MKDDGRQHDLSRRNFLRGAGLFGLGGALTALSPRPARGATPKPAKSAGPPSAYDLERFRKTDPALVDYEEVSRRPSPHPEPKRIVWGPGDKLWVTAGKQVTALDAHGEKVLEFSADEEVRCLAIAGDGRALAGLKDHVEVYDGQGKQLARWASPGKGTWLTSLAAGANDVFAADAGNRIVHRFDLAGKLVSRIGQKNRARGIPAFLVPSPYFDLEIGADGLLWVANPGLHQLQAFTFDGQLEKKWGEASFGIAGFCGCCNPSYFTRLADGRFVTSEKGLPRVKVYSAEGKFESVVAGPEAFPAYLQNINATPIPMDVAADAAGRVYVADTLGDQIRAYRRKAKV